MLNTAIPYPGAGESMRDREELSRTLRRIDGRGYKAYRDILGEYDMEGFTLKVDHVQSDPFAPPSRMRVSMNITRAGYPEVLFRGRSREVAFRDFLTRCFYYAARDAGGRGGRGAISIERPGQEILERSAAVLKGGRVEVRFRVALPAAGRRILGREAERILLGVLPEVVDRSLMYRNIDSEAALRHVETSEDADYLREHLREEGLVSFVADNSILPRRSGIDPRPLEREKAVPFRSPPSMRVELQTRNHGPISGMGIEEGVTLIVGGGYHGKSTLLSAIQNGVYNHIPGDGREFVVTVRDAVKIRAEDGRRVEKVDISPFISRLPGGADTREFSTENASGSTSQAANIIEALEAGATLLLMDEDTSATNFLIRDRRMQELVPKEIEPITPYIDRVRQLHEELGVSTILVLGGSGDYLDVADRVICMVEFEPHDFTERAREVSRELPSGRRFEGGGKFGKVTERIPLKESFDPSRGKKAVKIKAKGEDTILFGREEIDLSAVEQIVDTAQTRALADAIYYATRYMDGKRTLREVVDMVLRDVDERGLDVIGPFVSDSYAAFRGVDLAAAINRLRTLRVRQKR